MTLLIIMEGFFTAPSEVVYLLFIDQEHKHDKKKISDK